MSEDFDSLTQKKQAELDVLKSSMDDMRLQFIRNTTAFIAEWYEENAKIYVTTNSNITLNLGKERLGEMKLKVNELAKNASKIASEVLANPKIWWHLEPHNGQEFLSPYSQYGYSFPDILDKPIRRALGRLGSILEEYGYGVKTKPTHAGIPQSVWIEYTTDSTYPKPTAQPYYPLRLEWSQDMQDTVKQYNELYKQGIGLFREIENLQHQKKVKQSTDLWDSS